MEAGGLEQRRFHAGRRIVFTIEDCLRVLTPYIDASRERVKMSPHCVHPVTDRIHATRDRVNAITHGVNLTWEASVFDRSEHLFHAAWNERDP